MCPLELFTFVQSEEIVCHELLRRTVLPKLCVLVSDSSTQELSETLTNALSNCFFLFRFCLFWNSSYPHKKSYVNWTLTLCILALLSLLIGGGVDVVYFCLTPTLLLCLTACTQINRCGLVTAGILSWLSTGLCVLFALGIHDMVEACRENHGEIVFDIGSRLLKHSDTNNTGAEADNLQSSSSLTDDAVAVEINATSASTEIIEGSESLDTCDSLHVLFIVWCVAGGLWFLVGCLAFFLPLPKEHEYESLGDVDGFLTPSPENNEGDTLFDELNTPKRSEVV